MIPFKELPENIEAPSIEDQQQISVIVDAMGSIRRWSFLKGESYGSPAERYFRQLLTEAP